MDTKNFTTREQVERLIACGVNIKTADYTISGKMVVDHTPGDPRGRKEIPCWSLNALMNIVRWSIMVDNIEYQLFMIPSDGEWTVGYFSTGNAKSYSLLSSINPIDCLVDIIEKLKKDGFVVND